MTGTACYKAKLINESPAEPLFEGPVNANCFDKLSMNEKLTNFRPPEKQKEALKSIAQLPEGMVYIARSGKEIIGYVAFHYPDKYSRWSKHPRVLELGGIEISPEWRKRGIGAKLLEKAFTNPVLENFIVVAIEFCWHWDLKKSGLDVFTYQKMLAKLFGTVGLEKRATDDPDIIDHPANVLMARIGKNVKPDDIRLFEEMLYEKKPGNP